MYLPLIAIFIAISGSMGISYMAENSLPGEPLYPIKIHINDNLKQLSPTGVLSGEKETASLAETASSSSEEVYLKSSVGGSASTSTDIQLESDSSVDANASTSLDASRVINAE